MRSQTGADRRDVKDYATRHFLLSAPYDRACLNRWTSPSVPAPARVRAPSTSVIVGLFNFVVEALDYRGILVSDFDCAGIIIRCSEREGAGSGGSKR